MPLAKGRIMVMEQHIWETLQGTSPIMLTRFAGLIAKAHMDAAGMRLVLQREVPEVDEQ